MSEHVADTDFVLELAEEFVERCRQGQRPAIREYVERYPHLAGEIHEVFPALALMEHVAPGDESRADAAAPHAAHELPLGLEQLGDFRILREVGHGGMGIVYEAEQVSLGRHVALKILPHSARLSPRHHHRFEREARAAARLHHTNIVPVFGVGEQAGLCYYVMQFIQGLGLDAVLEELRRMRAGGPSGEPTLREPTTSPGREPDAAEIARSLMTGMFDQIQQSVGSEAGGWIEDGQDDGRRTSSTEHRTSNNSAGALSPVSRVVATTRHGPRTTDHGPPANPQSAATTAAHLSDTFRLSASGALSAGSAPALPGRWPSGRLAFWHSVAQIGVQVAAALQYAHDQGILHRDIKPSNLLLDLRGTVWVTDFGLAKVDDQQNITHSGDILGTLRYMPPEAFDGRSDARSDVYSLGLTLYELAALKPAFDVKDRHQLIREVTSAEPPRLERAVPEIPRDLATVIHKAIDRDPARRYQSARELGEEFGRFLNDQPVEARPISAVERLGRWCRHNPARALLTTAVALLLVSVAAVSTVSAFRIARARDDEAVQRQLAESHAEESRLRLVDAHVTSGMRLVEQGDLHGALPWLAEALRLDEHDPARAASHRLRLEAALDHSAKLVAVWVAEDGANRIEFCPDGRHIASGGTSGLLLRELSTGQITAELARGASVYDFVFSPDGRHVATAGKDGTARVWALAAGEPATPSLRHAAAVNSIRFDAEGRRVATASDDRTARIWDSSTGQLVRSFPHDGHVQSAVFSPDGLRLVTASQGDLRVWDVADGRKVFPTMEVDIMPRRIEVAFSSDGRRIIAGGGERTIRTWDAATGKPLAQIGPAGRSQLSPDGHRSASYSSVVQVWDVDTGLPVTPRLHGIRGSLLAAFSPRGDRLLTANWDGSAHVWDVATATRFANPLCHNAAVFSGAFSPDSRLVVTLDRGGCARVWDLAGTAHEYRQLDGDEWAGFVAVSPDGRRVAIDHGGVWGCVWLWDVAAGRLIDTLRDGRRATGERVGGALVWAAFSPPDGERLVTVFDHGSAQIWDASSGAPLTGSLRHSGLPSRAVFNADGSLKVSALISHAEFSPDGRQLLTASEDNTVRLWDAATGRLLRELSHDRPVHHATYSSDGRKLLTVTADGLHRWQTYSQVMPFIPIGAGETRVWDATTGQPLTPPLRHPGTVLRAAFSGDGKVFFTASLDKVVVDLTWQRNLKGVVQLWEAATNRPLGPPLVHSQEVTHAVLSPNGRWLATATVEGAIRLWDVATGTLRLSLAGHDGFVTQLAFSPGGGQLLSASVDGHVRVWEPATGQPIADFPHEHFVYRAAFTPSGDAIVTGCADATVHRWRLASARPAADWILLAETLAPGRGHDRTRAANEPGPLVAWQRARGSQSGEFTATTEEQLAWHRQSLAEAAAGRKWPAALAELDSLLAIDPESWSNRLARARLLSRLHRWVTAEAEFTRAVERHPDHSQVWAARGSYLLERGRREEAAADLTRAIELNAAPGLDAVLTEFWVAGPYVEDLRTAQPPEMQLDPTQPIPGPMGNPQDTSAPAAWESAAADASGFLDFGESFGRTEHISVYALAYVYSRSEQEVTVFSGSDDDLRLWLNGELIHEHPWPRPPFPDQDHVPAKLKGGWNTVLAKVVNRGGRHGVFLRLSGDPADLASALADRRRWNEALPAFSTAIEQQRGRPGEVALRSQRALLHARLGHWEQAHADYARCVELEPENHVAWYHRAPLRLRMGDPEGYVHECREMLARFRNTTHPMIAERLAKNCAILPDVADPGVLVELADRAVAGTGHSDLYPYFQSVKGMAEYRAGRCEQAIPWLQKSEPALENPPCKAMAQLFLSMAFERLGRHDEARLAFERATETITQHKPAEDSRDWGVVWHDWIRCRAVLREADAQRRRSQALAVPAPRP